MPTAARQMPSSRQHSPGPQNDVVERLFARGVGLARHNLATGVFHEIGLRQASLGLGLAAAEHD